jgi:hypothetical protein
MNQPRPEMEAFAPADPPSSGVAHWVEEQVRNTPWWLISIAFHLILLAGMTVITFKEELKSIDEPPQIVPVAKLAPKVPLVRPDDPFKNGFTTSDFKNVPVSDNDEPVLVDFTEAEDSDHNESANDMDMGKMKGQSTDFLSAMEGDGKGVKARGQGGPGVYDAIGVGGGNGSAGRYGHPDWGGRFNRRKVGPGGNGTGQTNASENAVTYGLWWLARHQGPEGGWSCAGFHDRCSGGTCDDPGYSDYDAGVTGLSLLAFLGAGYTHLTHEQYVDPISKQSIRYGEVVKKGVIWLMKNQDAEGCFGGRSGSKYMYNHAIAALAMCEAYGLTDASLFKESAQRGIDFLLAAQMPYKAWRYVKQAPDNDTSVTGWAVMALHAADSAKLRTSRAGYEGAKSWLLEVTASEYDGKVGYTGRGTGQVVVKGKNEDWDDHNALTAVGMMCRIFIDHDPKDPVLKQGAELLLADTPKFSGKAIDYYYWYYASLALFQYDGPDGGAWKKWKEPMMQAIVPSQQPKAAGCLFGSWDADVDRWGFEGGRVYTTAINVLTLEVFYRYANAFGRK